MAEKRSCILAIASFVHVRIGRSGWVAGTKSSSLTVENRLSSYPSLPRIVVHSTWRYMHDVDELKLLLGALGPQVVGATPRGPRYESIEWWLQMNPSFADHRILDDDASEFPTPPPPELILCNPTTGVAASDVLAALRAWLEG